VSNGTGAGADPSRLLQSQVDRLSEQLRLATAVQRVMEGAGNGLDLGPLLDDSLDPLVRAFACRGTWIRAFEGVGELPGLGRGALYPPDAQLVPSPHLRTLVRRVACACWREGRTLVLGRGTDPTDLLDAGEVDTLMGYAGQVGSDTVLLSPLGAGEECLGYLALTRGADQPDWSEAEVQAALVIGRHLGRAIRHARLYGAEQAVSARLRALDHDKTRLIATVAHELRTPITAMLGHLELLEESGVPPERVRSLAVLIRSTARIRGLVDDLVLLSRVTDPQRSLVTLPLDLAAVVDEAAALLEVQARHGDVHLQVGGDRPVLALGDAGELDRLVVNLVGNAVKYTPPGGHVEITVTAVDGTAELRCRDDGIGISEQDQQRLFEEFFRSEDPGVRARPGTGLGLAIAHRIVQRHHGSIDVSSAPGQGTTVLVRLPSRMPAAPGGTTSSHPGPRAAEPSQEDDHEPTRPAAAGPRPPGADDPGPGLR
jgi:signal transduction histidine kinase